MKKYLEALPPEIKCLISGISKVAARNHTSVYLVGGFVRDLFLGAKNFDLDIVLEGDGLNFAEELARELQAKLVRHRQFQTATVIVPGNLKIDIATARKESYLRPAALPVVSPSNLRDDLARRDFTINAMAISLRPQDQGELVDYFAGKADLFTRKIRVLHGLSFIDDPTRILRAVRFEQRYNFKIEAKTLNYLREAARLQMLEKTETQRLRDELILTLKETKALAAIRRLWKLAGFSFIDKRLKLKKQTYAFLRQAQRQIHWFEQAYPRRRPLDAWLMYFIVLINSLSLYDIRKILLRFCFRRGEEKRVLSYKKITPKVITALSSKQIRASGIFALLEHLSYEVILLLQARYKNRLLSKHIRDFFQSYNGMRSHIRGKDLRELGIVPGPAYQRILTKVLNARLDGLVSSRREELALLKELIKA